jgi:hypothetical protein
MTPAVGDGLACVMVGDTVVTLWRDPAAGERVKWLNDRLNEHAATAPGDILHLMLILSSSTPPGAEGRKLFQQQVTDLDNAKKLRHLIAAALGDQFWINIVRTVGRMILFMAGKSHLLTLVSSVDEALAVMDKHRKPTTPEKAAITEAILALAQTLGVHPSQVLGKKG